MAPQIIILVWFTLEMGMVLAKHGQPKGGRWSFWSHLFAIGALLNLMWWGGFFEPWF